MTEQDWEGQIDDAHDRLKRAKGAREPHFIHTAHVAERARKAVGTSQCSRVTDRSSGSDNVSRAARRCSGTLPGWFMNEASTPVAPGEVTLFISPCLSPRTLSVGEHLEFYEGQRQVATAEVTERHLDDS